MSGFAEIDRLKLLLDRQRPMPPAVVANLRESLVLNWTYHSNAIEGNSLSLRETKVVLEGITIGGKTLREHLEAINHREAIGLVEKAVAQGEPTTEQLIKSIHHLVLRAISDADAGVYRQVQVGIGGATHRPPSPTQVPAAMQALAAWCGSEAASLHPVERAARLHADFVKIHPFVDGNGRTSRLLMNLELMKSGFPPAVLPVERRLDYYDALDLACAQGDYQPFIALVEDVARDAFAPYWHALEIDPTQAEND